MQYDRITSEYFKVPNDLDCITSDMYEYLVLCFLLKLTNGGNNKAYPSLSTLSVKCKISRPTVVKTIKRLVIKEYITYKVGSINHIANEYTLNIDKILSDIRRGLTTDEITRQLTAEQRDAMAIKRCIKNPDLAHKAERYLGNQVTDGNGNEIKIGVKNE